MLIVFLILLPDSNKKKINKITSGFSVTMLVKPALTAADRGYVNVTMANIVVKSVTGCLKITNIAQ